MIISLPLTRRRLERCARRRDRGTGRARGARATGPRLDDDATATTVMDASGARVIYFDRVRDDATRDARRETS